MFNLIAGGEPLPEQFEAVYVDTLPYAERAERKVKVLLAWLTGGLAVVCIGVAIYWMVR
jgi:hypothetical protein